MALLALLHGWGLDPYLTPGFTELSSQAGFDPGGIWRDGVYAHGDYPRSFLDAAGQPQLRMSGYNLAAIAAGLPTTRWARRCFRQFWVAACRQRPAQH